MQSRLAAVAAKFNRVSLSGRQKQFLVLRLDNATCSGRAADPAEHRVEPKEVCATDAILDEKRRRPPEHEPTSKDNEPYVAPKSPIESGPKLESPGVGPRTDPTAQQRRRKYFKHCKAAPLSGIEMADTRKPVTTATDGTTRSDSEVYGGGGVILWRPEQLDTAADSLQRATEIHRRNAERGDPDSPHGRVLRQLRGEYW